MKALRTAAFVIGAAALVATGVGAAVGAGLVAAGTIGASAATLTAIGAGLSAASGILSIVAGAAAPKGSVGGSATKFKIDKEAGIPIVFGRSYSGGNVVHRQYYNRPGDKMKNQLESWVTILSLGLVQSVGPLLIDKAPVAFDAGGQAIGTYRGNMWLDTQRGACPEGRALAGPFGAFPGWNGSSRLSGLAADLWTLDFDSKGEKFPNGVPDRGRVIEGVLVYDPRLDSTYPGGNGPCRLGQPATYVYSECPGPHAITWAYGHYQNGVLVAGGGLSAAGIDMAPYVEWSNVCDANGWKVGGTVYATTDDAWDVLKMICQAGSAKPLPVGAQLSVTFSAPRVSIGTISSADISGDVDVPATVARRTRRNTIIPSVRLESHGWEMVPLDPVSVPAYIAIDGGRRPREISYPLVQNASQGAQLAMYEMLNDRELDGIVVPAKVYALGYRPGDCITLQIPEANLIGREVVVGQRELDVGTNGVTLVCRSEDSSKHAFALGKTTTPPPTPDLSNPGIDRSAPDAADWSAIGTTLNANGVSVPAIVITSSVDRIAAEEIVFDYRPRIAGASPDVNWTGASIEPSSVLRKEITSVTPNTAYDVGVRYRIRGAVSARLIIENVTVGDAALPWTNVSDPDGTRPDPNATNGADPNSPFGPDGKTVGDVQAAIDAAKARQDEFETETLPAIDQAVADAVQRVDAAAKTITNFDQRVTNVESSSGGGGNLLSNTDWAVDSAGWVFTPEDGSTGYLGAYGPDNYWPVGMRPLQIYTPNGSGNRAGHWSQIVRGIEGGGTYQASLYVGSHRATAGLYIDCVRANGEYNGTTFTKYTGKFNGGTRNLKDDYERIVINFTVPDDTAYIHVYLLKNGTLPGFDDSYTWFLRPQIAKVRVGVTEPVPYVAGSADAGAAALNARVNTVEQAGNDGRIALASRNATLEAAAMSPRSTTLNANPDFSFWPDVNGNKAPGWEWWNAAIGDAQRIPAEGRRSGWAYRHDVPAGTDMGWRQAPILIDAGWWVFEADTILRGGSYYGVGITLDGIDNFDFAREADTNGVISPNGINQRRRWSKLIKIGAVRSTFHLMQNWGGFAPMEAKQIDWYYCGIRPATDAEIAARKAIDVTIPAVSARVKVQEDAFADLPNQFATAKRATDLEAQVNGTADSNLLARANERAIAIADQKVGAVAESVQSLRVDYGGRIGSVEEKAAAIAGIDGRTSIYWGITGSTPNGKTGIGLYLKDGSPGDFIVNANMLVDGSILATGSIRSLAFDSDTMGRTGSASWAGSVEGVVGGANIPFSLTLNPIYPRGRFLIEAAILVSSDAGQTTITNNYQGTGKQLRVTRVAAGGGLFLRSYDDQGNVYQINDKAPFQSLPVLATTTFGTTFVASISKANYDTGVTDQGDYFQRLIAASYTCTSISMKATWIAT